MSSPVLAFRSRGNPPPYVAGLPETQWVWPSKPQQQFNKQNSSASCPRGLDVPAWVSRRGWWVQSPRGLPQGVPLLCTDVNNLYSEHPPLCSRWFMHGSVWPRASLSKNLCPQCPAQTRPSEGAQGWADEWMCSAEVVVWGHLPTLGYFQLKTADVSGMLGGTMKQWECTSHPLVHFLSLWFYLMLPCPSQSVTKEWLVRTAYRAPQSAASPALVLRWTAHGFLEGPTHHGQLLHPKVIRVRRMPVFLESQHMFVFLRVMVLSPYYFLSGYYYFFMARLSIRFF